MSRANRSGLSTMIVRTPFPAIRSQHGGEAGTLCNDVRAPHGPTIDHAVIEPEDHVAWKSGGRRHRACNICNHSRRLRGCLASDMVYLVFKGGRGVIMPEIGDFSIKATAIFQSGSIASPRCVLRMASKRLVISAYHSRNLRRASAKPTLAAAENLTSDRGP